MTPDHINNATHHFGPPQDWNDERDGRCGSLWVRQSDEPSGRTVFASAWRPTAEELAALNAGGVVVVEVFGGQPPIMISVEQGFELGVEAQV